MAEGAHEWVALSLPEHLEVLKVKRFASISAADGGDKQEDRGISKQVKVSKGEVKTENERNLNDMVVKKAEAQVQLDKLSKATTNE
jgi:hypothetical protein